MSFITGKQLPRRTFLRGAWRHGGAAIPGCDGAGGALAAPRRRAERTRLVCIEEVHGLAGCNDWGAKQAPVRPGADRPRLHAGDRQRAQVARAVPRAPDHHQQHRRAHGRGVLAAGNRRRPLPLERGVPDPVAPEADAGLGHLVRHLDGPALRAEVRAVHADAVDAVLHREPGPGRRLHLQLLVRLHRLDQLGVAERPAADDSRPARGVRHAVRLGQLEGRSRRAPPDAPQHPRLDRCARWPTSARNSATGDRNRLDRYLDHVREIERRIQAIEARNTSGEARELPTRRPACPTRSPST